MVQNVNAGRRSADYTARSVQEAIERAAADLKVSVSELDYTVLRDSTHTILGLVRTGEATIRVWLKEGATPLGSTAPGMPPVSASFVTGASGSDEWTESAEDTLPDEAEDTDEGAHQADEPEQMIEDEELADDDYGEPEEQYVPASSAMTRSEQQDLARVTSDVVTRLLDGMGLYAAVEVVERGGQVDPETHEVAPLQVNIIGDDLGVLIGRRGETLRDLQFLTRLIVSRKIGKWPNIVVDVEGYKSRRAETLQALARRMADRVRTTHQPVTLEPMPAYERRIVHLTLRNDKDVYTESTGEGESRKVQILPKNQ